MGKSSSKLMDGLGAGPPEADVNFDSFEILRAIGRGSFGKVHTVSQLLPSINVYFCFGRTTWYF